MRVLLLDDNPDDRELVKCVLEETEGRYQLDCCSTSGEFFARFDSANYDALLLDFFLSETDGFEILRGLRERKNQTPVIFFSGTEKDDIILKVMQEGADDFVIKSRTSLKTLPLVLKRSVLRKELQPKEDLGEERLDPFRN